MQTDILTNEALSDQEQPASRVKIAAVVILYVALHIFLQWLSNISDQENTASIWYPVAGLAFAAISYYGAIGALLVFFTICISHALIGDPRINFLAIILYALCVSALTLMWRNIFIRLGVIGRQLTQTPRWAIGLMSMAVLVAATNTIAGELLLAFSGIVPTQELFQTTISFFLGDLTGIMSIAPLLTLTIFPRIIPWKRAQPASPWRWQRAALIYLVMGALGLQLLLVANTSYHLLIVYLGAIPILLAAVRGRVRETCLAISILTVFLAIGMASRPTAHPKEITAFLILMMAVAYVVTTAVSTNRAILKSLESALADRDRLTGEQQKLGEQVTRLQSMEALGTLAGGMAHELNNLLQPILTFSRAAETATDTERKTYLDRVRECTLAAKSLVQDVLTFARNGAGSDSQEALKMTRAEPLIKSCIDIACKALPSTVQLSQQHAVGMADIKCVPPQLVQILINLFRNAADAKARNIIVQSKYDAESAQVTVSVRDDGLGMDGETSKRAFEPFFTTKQIGRGTGLGLSVVYGLVTSWGGDLRIDSVPGEGTNMTLNFPAQVG